LRLGCHMHQVWHLSEYHEGNLGLACTEDGLFLGRTPLIERQGARFAIRQRTEIERLLRCAYGEDLTVDRLLLGLATVTAALNANDPGVARIAAVHLRIPDLPNQAARDCLEAEDVVIKSINRVSAVRASDAVRPDPDGAAFGDESFPLDPTDRVYKASPDDPKHPGWPAGTEGGRGGQFRPKDASELTQKVKSLIARRALRTGLLAALRIGLEGLGNLIPGVDVAADVAMVADIALTVAEFRKLAIDATAALDFVEDGPHSLEDLQVSSPVYEEFSSYDEVYKSELSLELLAKWFGPAGDGQQYHHIVTQGGTNAENILPEQLQNTDNVILLPTLLHEAVNAEYSKLLQDGTGMTMYQWLQTQSYDVQREEGLKILRRLNILK
jgi:hypothetical protein